MVEEQKRETTGTEYLHGGVEAIKNTIRPLITRLSKVKSEMAELAAKENGLTTTRWRELCKDEDLLDVQIEDAIVALKVDAQKEGVPPRVCIKVAKIADALYNIFLDSVHDTEDEYSIPDADIGAAYTLLKEHKIDPVIYGEKPRGRVLQ